MRRTFSLLLSTVALWAGSVGCRQPLPPSELESLPDAAQDGFVDVAPPQGVAFDETNNVSVHLENSIAQSDLATIAQANGLDPELLGLVTIVGRATIELNYAGGQSDTIEETVEIVPFERRFEAACPEYVEVQVSVDVYPPVGEAITLFESTVIRFNADEDYTCGTTIAYAAFVNDLGEPIVEPIDL